MKSSERLQAAAGCEDVLPWRTREQVHFQSSPPQSQMVTKDEMLSKPVSLKENECIKLEVMQ